MGIIISSFLSTNSIHSILSFVGGEAKYIWGLEGNLADLGTAKVNLNATKEDLLNKVKLEEQQPRTRRTAKVVSWLEKVEEMGTKVAALENYRDEEIDRLCLGGFCSKDLISSYNFGKDVVTLKNDVIALTDEGDKLREVTEEVPEDPAVELAVAQTVVGQEYILDRVWRRITDKEKNWGIIGLYGKGGVGKTTLLKQVNNKFRAEQHNFNVVIWAVVSQETKLEKIQDDIGKRIGLSAESWQEKRIEDKALDISNILSQKKFVLLLDDIWQPIELTDLGVPLQNLNIGSKIVFTTRSVDVCDRMEAEKLEVSCLSHDEAWKLFQKMVERSTLDGHPSIPELAETLARECGGLPLALKAVGRAMKSQRKLGEWERAIKKLSTEASKFSVMEEKVFSRLKFSYDNLPKDELRSCLLYCCLYPEDYKIPEEELIDYWISEGFVDDFDDGCDIIVDLRHACLLEEEDDCVKIHDMIREMALWIACKIEKKFLVCADVRLTEAPKIEEWKEVKRISLMRNKIVSLSQIPTCPHLQTLLLNENKIEMIIDGFFQFMPSLKVLSIKGNRLSKLPPEISRLVLLQHLDLSRTRIDGLPQELKALVNLRFLNLEYTSYLSRIPKQLISRFSKLQVLKMLKCGSVVDEGSVLSYYTESLIEELLCLEHLTLISLTLNGSLAVQHFLDSPKLVSITQSLSIRNCRSLPLINFLHLASMEKLKLLHIDGGDVEELNIECTGEVEEILQSRFCSSLHTVGIDRYTGKDLTWLAFLQNLKEVVIHFSSDIE